MHSTRGWVRGILVAVLALAGVGRLAFCAAPGGQEKVTDQNLGRVSGRVLNVVRSETSEGCRLAIVTALGDKQLVLLDGQAGPEYDEICEGDPVFSPDGKCVAYTARKGDKWLVVVDGQAGPEYDGIACGPVFLKHGTAEYISQRGGTLYRVNHRP